MNGNGFRRLLRLGGLAADAAAWHTLLRQKDELPIQILNFTRAISSQVLIGLMRSLGASRARWSFGSAAVELATTAPVLVLVALGAADYGALMGNGASLEGATRAVAEYARNSP